MCDIIRRVFVLGAGASKEHSRHFKRSMPLNLGFFNHDVLNEFWPITNEGAKTFRDSELRLFLEHYFDCNFKFRSEKCTEGADLDLERCLSFIESIRSFLPGYYKLDFPLEQARKDLLEYIRHVVVYIPYQRHIREKPDKKKYYYDYLASTLKPNDSIITFNWDVMLDYSLTQNEIGRNLLSRQLDLLQPKLDIDKDFEDHDVNRSFDAYYLKLHGSVNICICSNNSCLRNTFPVRFSPRWELGGIEECDLCGSLLENLMLPPNFNKKYNDNRFSQVQFQLASNILSSTSELIVVGYSFPDFDISAQTLFRAARTPLWMVHPKWGDRASSSNIQRICLVNPEIDNKEYIKRFKKIFGITSHDKTNWSYGHPIKFDCFASIEDYRKKRAVDWPRSRNRTPQNEV